MTKIRFPDGNRILYGQDFSYHRGLPSDIDFEIVEYDENRAILKGPGYGGLPYGNGRISISRTQKLPPLYQAICDLEATP